MSVDIKVPCQGGIPYADLDTDTTLAGNSDTRIPTQKAVKAYADAIGSSASGASIPLTSLSTDGTMAGNSDTDVPSEKAVVTFVGSQIGAVLDPTGLVFAPTEVTASAALPAFSYIELNKADGALAMTLVKPTIGRVLVVTQTDAGTSGHTLTLGLGTFDGTNEIATFDASGETLIMLGISDTRFAILANIGSVGLSHAA